MNSKLIYEEVEIEVIPATESDIITSSLAFDGDDDLISAWRR